jgi:hypothetical protein
MLIFAFYSLYGFLPFGVADVILNEIHFNPPDDGLEAGTFREFIELYNPGSEKIDLSGYYFDKGITYTFSSGTLIEPGQYIVLALNPNHSIWRNRAFKIVGPYQGRLADSGERLTLNRPDGTIVEELKYEDTPPWPQGPDGYGATLERLAANLPAQDFHSWRASERAEGTPGRENSVHQKYPAYPMLLASTVNPAQPTSEDRIYVEVGLDAPEQIESVLLQWEQLAEPVQNEPVIGYGSTWRYWKGFSSPGQGLDWTTLDYNDLNWLVGYTGFGYGDLDMVTTVLDDMRGNYSTLYGRRRFTLSSEDLTKPLLLRMFYDDGFICYINGVEVARANAPQTYDAMSLATGSHEGDQAEVFPIPSKLLQEGRNVLAIVGFNINQFNSTDFVLTPILEIESGASQSFLRLPMQELTTEAGLGRYATWVPTSPSQTLVRMNVEVTLESGQSVLLPHEYEPNPFISYFVYDGDMPSRLPILWMLPPIRSALLNHSRLVGGVVSLPVGQEKPDVFDGSIQIPSASERVKVRFLKGAEFYGDRTINIIPEVPTGGTNAGISSPYREHLGFWFFETMGVPSPWSTFYRVIPLPYSPTGLQTQRLVNEQVNEKFLERVGLNPDADLYKLVYTNPNWEKHTNKDDGTSSIQDLLKALLTPDINARRQAMVERLELDEFLAYSAASIFTSNWDGYWNNNWMYLDPDTLKWQMIPWDLDWIWGATPPPNTGAMYARMPLSFPIDGVAIGNTSVSRAPGPVTSPIHQEPEFYKAYVQTIANQFNRTFGRDFLFAKMQETEDILIEDYQMIQHQTGRAVGGRIQQVRDSYNTLKTYVDARRAYLEPLLPVRVDEWTLY